MRFEVGDRVVHPKHGVGHVVRLEERHFGREDTRLYYRVAIENGTIWVPVGAPECGLRKLTSRGDLARYGNVLKSRPAHLSSNYRQRQLELTERMRMSSFRARCEVVRDLSALGWRKPLGESSAVLLRAAHEVLDAEWAAVKGLTVHEAAHQIEALLLEGKRAYMG
jgi:CarD family transcriptional regulator